MFSEGNVDTPRLSSNPNSWQLMDIYSLFITEVLREVTTDEFLYPSLDRW